MLSSPPSLRNASIETNKQKRNKHIGTYYTHNTFYIDNALRNVMLLFALFAGCKQGVQDNEAIEEINIT